MVKFERRRGFTWRRQGWRYVTQANVPLNPTLPVQYAAEGNLRVTVFPGTRPTDGKLKWYWRAQARNNRIVDTGGEAFNRRRTAVRAARRAHPPA